MARKKLPLVAALGFLLAAGGAFLLLWGIPVLQVKNLDRAGRTLYFRIDPPERFSLTYRHSIYDAPVTEEFEAGQDRIVLKGVRTSNAGVMEYYGFDQVREYLPREVVLAGPVVIKKGIREGQGLIIQGRLFDLGSLAEAGERVELRVYTMSVVDYVRRAQR